MLETLFSNHTTLIQRAIRESDGVSVILKSLVAAYPTQTQLQQFTFASDVAKKFDHPNILRVLDDQEQNNLPVLVLEDCKAIDLQAFTQQQIGQRLTVLDFLTIAIQIAEALGVIHHAHVIHKDLHPGNVLINPQSLQVQITDFGLASILSREQPALASPEKIEGILSYLSPEQTGRMNRALDYRTDFYTLGVTFYQLLSGRLPFDAEDALGIVHAHIAKAHQPLIQLDLDIPVMVSEIIDKLLRKSAEERYQSAQGLKCDLEKCLQAYQKGDLEATFKLAENDVSDRFQISQKLYGRKAEVNTLLEHFLNVTSGEPQLLCVSGYSGVGKSVLINEVHKPIAAHNGLFLAGKFDQYQHATPYYAIKQLLKTWLLEILSLPESLLKEYRFYLKGALGTNARVLLDIMADFKLLLGELPELPTLGADEAQNRLHFVLLKLFAFISEERPLVIFVDDLQWADRSSLSLLALLMSDAECALLIIVAYRDNEVDSLHPAMQMINTAREQKPGSMSELSLGPLSLSDTRQLVMDSLHCSETRALSLVEVVHQKTGGNPFFINEFLKTLYSENLLNFDLSTNSWQWDSDKVLNQGITDNVVDLMLRKMRLLPPAAQRILQLASCIGTRFEIELLAVMAEQKEEQVLAALWPALDGGLVLQERLFSETKSVNKTQKLITHVAIVQFRFLHDRMLQAAYQSMTSTEQQQTHLKIGRLLRNRYIYGRAAQSDDSISSLFSIAEQLNHGRDLIEDASEQLFLAELNQQAADLAKSNSAWDAVVKFADVGMSLLPNNRWQACYQLTFSLLKLKAEGEYLCGRPETSDLFYSELLKYCHEDISKAEIYATRSIEHSGRGLWQAAIDYGMQGLSVLGYPMTDYEGGQLCKQGVEAINAYEVLLIKEKILFDKQTEYTPIAEIEKLPEMTDPRKLLAIKMLSTITACSFLLNDTVLMSLSILRGLNMVLMAGKSNQAGNQLSWLAVWLVQRRDYTLSLGVAEQALKLLKFYPNAQELAGSYNLLAGLVLPMEQTYNLCSSQHRKAYLIGLENGEIARGVISLNNTLFLNYSSGQTLTAIQSQAEDIIRVSHRKKVFAPQGVNILALVKALIIPNEQAAKLFEVAYSSEVFNKIKGSLHEYTWLHYRAELAFWYGDYETSYELAYTAHEGFKKGARFCLYMDHLFQYGLVLLSSPGVLESGQARNSDVKALSGDFSFCLQELKELAEVCPMNFEHKYQLLLAEQGRYQHLPMGQVTIHYQKAIASAKEHGFIQYQALANELLAIYLQGFGLEDATSAYLEEAMYLYQRWGCGARIQFLKQKYAQLIPFFNEALQNKSTNTDSDTVSAANFVGSVSTSIGLEQASDDSGLDFESVMKSSQIIASELKLKDLAQKIMGVLIESAGAQSAALILSTVDGACVQARIPEESAALSSTPIPVASSPAMLEDCKDLPRSIISYALRTNTIVNIADMADDSVFKNDPYLKSQSAQSILCVPVEYREKTIGVLYLENKLTANAFTKSRLSVIKMLLSQAAISLENARLFEETSHLTQGLEVKVAERTEALSESNNALQLANEELNAFSYSVSHDLRSPLRTMKGFSQILLSDYADTLDSMGLGLLQRIKVGSSKMGDLINSLLELSRVQGQSIELDRVNLSDLAHEIVQELKESNSEQRVEFICEPNVLVKGDQRMLSSVMVNLLNNAWKYSAKKAQAIVSFGTQKLNGKTVYYVKDNGAGFDMEKADMLFGTFQRMHSEKEFSGTGIGLATVKRIINRHKGEVWAEAEKGKGATFYFTL